MTNKTVFYSLLALMVLVSGYSVYRLFFESTGGAKIAEAIIKDTMPKWRPGMKLSESMKDTEPSVWQDLQTGEDLKGRVGQELKTSAEVQNNLGLLVDLYDQGMDDEFLKKIEDLIRENPTVPEYIALLGDFYYNDGQWGEAEESIERLLTLNGNNLFARTTLGEVQAIQGNYDQALQSLDEVLQRDPGYMDALYGQLSVHEMKGMAANNPELARTLTDQGRNKVLEIARKNPQNANAQSVAADVAGAMGNFPDREKIIRNCRTQHPQHAGCARLDSVDLSRNGKYKEAIEAARVAYDNERSATLRRQTLEINLKAAMDGHDEAEQKRVSELIRQEEQREFGE